MAVKLADMGESGIFRQTKLDWWLCLKSSSHWTKWAAHLQAERPVSSMYSVGYGGGVVSLRVNGRQKMKENRMKKIYIYISYNRGVFFLEGERKQKNVGELQSLRYRVAAQIPRKAVCASGGGRIPRRFLFRFLIRTRVFFLILPLLFSFSLSLQFFIFSFDDAQCQKVHSFLVSWMRWPFHYPVMNWKRVKE